MSDKPKADNQANQPEIKERGSIISEGNLPKLASEPQTNYREKAKKYGGKILWLIKAVPRGFRWFFKLCHDNSGGVTAIATIVIAVLTLFYVIYSRGQLAVIDGQLKEMQAQARPYVFATAPLFQTDLHSVALTVVMNNFGTSPAINEVHTHPDIEIDTDPGVEEKMKRCSFSYPTKNVDPNIMPPAHSGVSQTMPTVYSRFITDDEWNVIKRGNEHIVVFGGIKYSGVRGGNYETKYCFRWNGQVLVDPNTLPWSTCACGQMK